MQGHIAAGTPKCDIFLICQDNKTEQSIRALEADTILRLSRPVPSYVHFRAARLEDSYVSEFPQYSSRVDSEYCHVSSNIQHYW